MGDASWDQPNFLSDGLRLGLSTLTRLRRLCFLTQSVETIENKGVVFFVSAKMCKRVRKNMKRKGIVENICTRLKVWTLER